MAGVTHAVRVTCVCLAKTVPLFGAGASARGLTWGAAACDPAQQHLVVRLAPEKSAGDVQVGLREAVLQEVTWFHTERKKVVGDVRTTPPPGGSGRCHSRNGNEDRCCLKWGDCVPQKTRIHVVILEPQHGASSGNRVFAK